MPATPITKSGIQSAIEKYGKGNIIALLPCDHMRNLSRAGDGKIPCVVTEKAYKVDEGYKVEFETYTEYNGRKYTQAYYQGDFDHMVSDGVIELFAPMGYPS